MYTVVKSKKLTFITKNQLQSAMPAV